MLHLRLLEEKVCVCTCTYGDSVTDVEWYSLLWFFVCLNLRFKLYRMEMGWENRRNGLLEDLSVVTFTASLWIRSYIFVIQVTLPPMQPPSHRISSQQWPFSQTHIDRHALTSWFAEGLYFYCRTMNLVNVTPFLQWKPPTVKFSKDLSAITWNGRLWRFWPAEEAFFYIPLLFMWSHSGMESFWILSIRFDCNSWEPWLRRLWQGPWSLPCSDMDGFESISPF